MSPKKEEVLFFALPFVLCLFISYMGTCDQVPCGTETEQKPPRCRKQCQIAPLCRHRSNCKVCGLHKILVCLSDKMFLLNLSVFHNMEYLVASNSMVYHTNMITYTIYTAFMH